jgi:hypothetical protein
MNAFRMLFLVLRNHVDNIGLGAYLSKVFALQLLNVFVFATLFSSVKNHGISVHDCARQACYFIPLLALGSSIGSWEVELVSLLGEDYLLRSNRFFSFALVSRVFLAFAETAFPVVVFLALIIWSGLGLSSLVIGIGYWVVFTILGAVIGFAFGFHGEKSINNILNSIAWVLGFGPGPFMGFDVRPWQFLFPGSHATLGRFEYEWMKLAGWLALSVLIFHLAKQPRERRFFSR